MRVFSLIPALAVIVTAVAGSALPREANCGTEAGCEAARFASSKRDFFEHPTRAVHGLTNAALLRRGLPLKSPIMRRGTPVRRQNPSGVPEPGPDPIPNPDPTKDHRRGIIRVKGPEGDDLGYISSYPFTPLYAYQPDISRALIVHFDTDETGSGSKLNLVPENSNIPNFGFLGLIQGRDNTDSFLSSGSFHHAYLGGTDKTPPGSPPANVANSYTASSGISRTAQSAVWNYDSGTGNLFPQWVNPDETLPPVQFFAHSTLIYTVGDIAAFSLRYPISIISISFQFVEL